MKDVDRELASACTKAGELHDAIRYDEFMGVSAEFGPGFSLSNVKLMRSFFLQYRERADRIGQTVSGQSMSRKGQTVAGQSQPAFTLSWSHYVF